MDMLKIIPILFGINLLVGLVLYVLKKKDISKLIFGNTIICPLIFLQGGFYGLPTMPNKSNSDRIINGLKNKSLLTAMSIANRTKSTKFKGLGYEPRQKRKGFLTTLPAIY